MITDEARRIAKRIIARHDVERIAVAVIVQDTLDILEIEEAAKK